MISDRIKINLGLDTLNNQVNLFIQKYSINPSQLISIFNQIFTNEKLPTYNFKQNFDLISSIGGIVLNEKFFERVFQMGHYFKEQYVYILEDNEDLSLDDRYCFMFPISMTWADLNSGDVLSFELFNRPVGNYFIFGDSANWGNYLANDYFNEDINFAGTPISIMGFDPHYSDLFKSLFPKPDQKEMRLLNKWLPNEYMDRWIYRN